MIKFQKRIDRKIKINCYKYKTKIYVCRNMQIDKEIHLENF